ncbi:MAG: glycosyltransferase [Nanobdellota archaeon]
MSLKDKNLLIISSGYPTKDGKITSSVFVKSQVDELKKYFNKIIVISAVPYFPKILSKIDYFKNKFKSSYLLKDYSYDNVEVYYPNFFTLPINYFRKRNGDFAYKATKKCIEQNNLNFDLIHAHFTWPCGYVGAKLKEDYGKKSIVTIHENRNWFLEEFKSNNPKLIKSWKENYLLIRVNEIDVPLLKKHNLNTITIPNGFNSSKFKRINNISKEKLKIPSDKKILLNVAGYKISHKNHINLIKAIKELVKIRQDFILYLIGNGPDKQKIINKIKELKLEEYVKVLGPKPHDEIPLWMNVADLFVFPSYSESFGVVNIEALACGTPVVSTVNGGSESIITKDDYGFLLKNPNNYKELSELINKALNKKWDKKKIINYSKKYHWDKIARKIVKEYEKVLK